MAEDHAESQITVHYSRDFHVSGKRVLKPLSSIDGVGGGHRNSTYLVLPIMPIIARKACGSGYQLLNFGDSRVTSQLSEFNSSTMIEGLLVSENIEQVRAVTGEIYPQIRTKVPTTSFLQHLTQDQSLGKYLSEFFGCSSSRQGADFSINKLASLLAPNGPSKATIERTLKKIKNPGTSKSVKAALNEAPAASQNGKQLQTSEDLLSPGQYRSESESNTALNEAPAGIQSGIQLQTGGDSLSQGQPQSEAEPKATHLGDPAGTKGGPWLQSGEDLLTSSQAMTIAEQGAKAREKWCTFFNRDPGEFSTIEAKLRDIEIEKGRQLGHLNARFYNRIMSTNDHDALDGILREFYNNIKIQRSQ